MTMTPPLIFGPIPAYNNVPIEPQFFQPSRFVIDDIAYGATTLVTTTTDANYVIGQLVRLLIPPLYGAFQLNNAEGYVIALPASDEVEVEITSRGTNTFISNPITAAITGATQADPCVLTCVAHFLPGQYIHITGVVGMLELNDQTFRITASNATTVTIAVDASGYAAYTSGGTATLLNYDTTVPQIIALGDVNSGIISATGRNIPTTNIPGGFINIS